MTTQPATSRCKGISWRGGRSALALTTPDGHEEARPIARGEHFALRLTGLRGCVGFWGGRVRRCPFDALIRPDATDAQCEACAGADPGRALARDAVRDARPFRLYLAWFGPQALKVGICAAQRNTERVLEQGAVCFSWLASGDHTAIRAAEQAVAASGLAVERQRSTTKLAGWRQLGSATERAAALQNAHKRALGVLGSSDALTVEPCEVVDHVSPFGLDSLPGTVDKITGVAVGSVITGRVIAVAGQQLVLETADRAVVISGRLLSGWPVDPDTSPTNVLNHCDNETLWALVDEQQSLF